MVVVADSFAVVAVAGAAVLASPAIADPTGPDVLAAARTPLGDPRLDALDGSAHADHPFQGLGDGTYGRGRMLEGRRYSSIT